jgi:hypothetical protein
MTYRTVNLDEIKKVLRFYADPPEDVDVPDFYWDMDFGAQARELLIQLENDQLGYIYPKSLP